MREFKAGGGDFLRLPRSQFQGRHLFCCGGPPNPQEPLDQTMHMSFLESCADAFRAEALELAVQVCVFDSLVFWSSSQ